MFKKSKIGHVYMLFYYSILQMSVIRLGEKWFTKVYKANEEPRIKVGLVSSHVHWLISNAHFSDVN